MSEEEIINTIKTLLLGNDEMFDEIGTDLYFSKSTAEVIQGLLDLYNKEKENNKKLDKENQALFEAYNFNDTNLLAKILKEYKLAKILKEYKKEFKNSISKDKIRKVIYDLSYPIDNDNRFIDTENLKILFKKIKELLGE